MPQLIDFLAFRAALEPDTIAVQRPQHGLTYAQLHQRVRRVAASLRRRGVRPGQLVVTSLPDKELDWLFTLALAHEAAVSCSNQGRAPWAGRIAYDWFITDEPGGAGEGANVIRVDAGWLKAIRETSADIQPLAWPSAEAPARIVLTSGTTGERKAVALSEAQIVGRAQDGLRFRGCARNLSLMQLSGAAELNACVTALLFGAPVYVAQSSAQVVDMVRRFDVDGIFGSPLQLGELARHLETTDERLAGVRIVRMAGATPARGLVEAIGERITANIMSLYGSTEAGGMGAWRPTPASDPSIAGVRHPGAQVEVVDADGKPLPEGEEGAVRVRAPFMASGYVADPEASAKAFRDGWFYPGDRGLFQPGGVLRLAGRADEVINRGGMKLDPQVIDEFLRAHPGVRDAAVFVSAEGVTAGRIVAAVVPGEGFGMRGLRAAVAERFKGQPAPQEYIRVTHIPRTATGKVRRPEMARLFAAHAARSA